ncbi:hypothetical protein [Streptomyces griseus]|uniref:hypothetical protein n=1 Tax=Streptomyces griseus TaxID=1911 RepID=UPI000AF8138C
MNEATRSGATPAEVSVNVRPMATAGFEEDVEEVDQYAAPRERVLGVPTGKIRSRSID